MPFRESETTYTYNLRTGKDVKGNFINSIHSLIKSFKCFISE